MATEKVWSESVMSGTDAKKRWNKRSTRFGDMEIPDKDDEYVSLILETSGDNLDKKNILDIGCGSGVWSLALARDVHSVLGIDIADKIIDEANKKAISESLNNVEYKVGDWRDLDLNLDNLKFDIVMAHMTPAINSDSDLIRMDAICDGYCYLTSSIGGESNLRRSIEEKFNIDLGRSRQAIPNAMRVLFEIGRKPLLRYEDRVNQKEETIEEVMSFYTERVSSKGVSEEDLENHLNDISVDGTIKSEMKMTKVTLYWHT